MAARNARYVLCPGSVHSQSDGQWHWISAAKLARLYGVRMSECRIHRTNKPTRDYGDAILLYPRYRGDYREYLEKAPTPMTPTPKMREFLERAVRERYSSSPEARRLGDYILKLCLPQGCKGFWPETVWRALVMATEDGEGGAEWGHNDRLRTGLPHDCMHCKHAVEIEETGEYFTCSNTAVALGRVKHSDQRGCWEPEPEPPPTTGKEE